MRQYNRRFWLSAHNCQVPTPTSQNLELEQQFRIFFSWLTKQLLGRLKSTIPNLPFYLPKKANSEKLGLGIDNPYRIVCLSSWMNSAWKGLMTGIFWNPGVFSYAMIPRCRPNSRFFFFIVTSIVYGGSTVKIIYTQLVFGIEFQYRDMWMYRWPTSNIYSKGGD